LVETRLLPQRAVVAEVQRQHALDVAARLAIRRHAAEATHRGGPGVVGGERQLQVVVEAVQQVAQVARAGAHVGVWVGRLRRAVGLRRRRHQLHEPLRAARRDGGGVETRLGLHHRRKQQAVEAVALGGLLDDRAVGDVGEQLVTAGLSPLVAEEGERAPPVGERRQRPFVGEEAFVADAAGPVGELLEHRQPLDAG